MLDNCVSSVWILDFIVDLLPVPHHVGHLILILLAIVVAVITDLAVWILI